MQHAHGCAIPQFAPNLFAGTSRVHAKSHGFTGRTALGQVIQQPFASRMDYIGVMPIA